MPGLLPPMPTGVPPGHPYWNDWYEKLRSLINDTTINFTDLDFAGSNLTSIATRNHNDLQNIQGGAAGDHYHLTNAQATDLTDGGDSAAHFHSADRARANHTGTQAYSTISDGAVGTYTPTLTNVTNVAASGALTAFYIRAGNIVTVAGAVTIDPTAAGNTVLGISLPIASNLGTANDVAGTTATSSVLEAGIVNGDVANDRAQIVYNATDLGNKTWRFTFMYQII